MFKICCYTLFDITRTEIRNRYKIPDGVDEKQYIYQRNTQINFDTILQVISLRSQPENMSYPEKSLITVSDADKFGSLYKEPLVNGIPCWSFTFDIFHLSVFDDGNNRLGYLYNDCADVPMILCGTEYYKVQNFLDISDRTKNIFFNIIS